MKVISRICTGIIIMLAGCGPAIDGGRIADTIPDGWYSPDKTDLQLSEDTKQCHDLCVSA